MNPLVQTEDSILPHLCRYRITTVPAILKAVVPGTPEAEIRRVLRRLSVGGGSGLLTRRPLFAKSSYYQLTARGARELGQPEEVAKPLGPQALPKCFGVLAFCCLSDEPRKRITRSEFEDHLANLLDDGLPFNDYFLEGEGDHTCLNRIIVDLGGDAERLARKLDAIARDLQDIPSAFRLYDSGQLGFCVVTTSVFKQAAILAAAEKICPNVPVTASVIAELIQLLPNFYE